MYAILEIDRWQSRCSACGHAADPDEVQHLHVIGWGGTTLGCGAEFVAMRATYRDGTGTEREQCQALRPDLPYVVEAW